MHGEGGKDRNEHFSREQAVLAPEMEEGERGVAQGAARGVEEHVEEGVERGIGEGVGDGIGDEGDS